ncbi:MAG TPA: SUMF1/EgtB/PvdO family nonheme iron enzyme [Polyangiaceae bacterium]|nr:SUMF1/EgtB/PvdO family nonheme iron enzyme [Polyangiaceae bacterium]
MSSPDGSRTPTDGAVAAPARAPSANVGLKHWLLVGLALGALGFFVSAARSHGADAQPKPKAPAAPRLDPPPAPDVSAAPAPAACPADMVLVQGSYCTDVRQDCQRWLDPEGSPFARCAEYSHKSRCVGKRVEMRFCIDRREYTPPGQKLPQNEASFDIASKTCKGLGKRICTDNEWNFACEGEDMLPYPYGYERKAVCNQDQTKLFEKNPHMQVLRDLREPADARPECTSPFGVENMTGNMDEPVAREGFEKNAPFRNALKGGWWMPARNRCRPATTAHDDYFKDIQIGVRCCDSAGPE